jgi:branched-subunit amino acid aminotransferase/4-amino-4-deoxychorismate lyase
MKEAVFFNGKFLPLREARVKVTNAAFLYGWGLFETMRAYNSKIVYLDKHIARIKNSAKLLGITSSYSGIKLKKIIKRIVDLSGNIDAYVRLILWNEDDGNGILVFTKKYKPYSSQKYNAGFSGSISRFRQDENAILARFKTTSQILYQLSLHEAKKRGFDEAIILNSRGYLAEGSRSNIFLVKSKALFTPSLACGCLDGITRKVVFALAKKNKIKVYEGNFTLQDLYNADEAFLTNSLIGIMPLVSLKRQKIGKAKCGRLTKFLIKKYRSLLK